MASKNPQRDGNMSVSLDDNGITNEEEEDKANLLTRDNEVRVLRKETAEVKKTKFDLDGWLEPLGGFGKFQIFIILQISVIIAFNAITDFSFTLTAAPLNHRCLIKECETERSPFAPPWLSSAIPKTGDGQYELCRRYKYLNTSTQLCNNKSFSNELVNCKEFLYDTEEWTIARENWSLQCEWDTWKFSLIGSLGTIAGVFANFSAGYLADRFGRKNTIAYKLIITAVIAIIKSLSVNYAMFAASEFIQSLAGYGIYSLSLVLAVELVDPPRRLLMACVVNCAYAFGEMIFPAIQWLTLDWRASLQCAYTPFLFGFVFIWTLPESTRWLLAKSRKEELLEILQKIAKMNGSTVPRECAEQVLSMSQENVENSTDKKSELVAAWKSKIVRNQFAVSLLLRAAATYTYVGLSLLAVSISENKYLDAISSSVMEVPANLFAFWMMGLPRFGRRYTICGFFFLCAVCSISLAYTPEDQYWLRLVLLICAKSGTSNAGFAVSVISTELFPTKIRGRASSWGFMFGYIVSILAPQTPLLNVYYKAIPLLIISVAGAVACAFSLYLPETLGAKLPETVHEAELLSSGIKDRNNCSDGEEQCHSLTNNIKD